MRKISRNDNETNSRQIALACDTHLDIDGGATCIYIKWRPLMIAPIEYIKNVGVPLHARSIAAGGTARFPINVIYIAN